MDKDLAKMLARAKANPESLGPFPLVDQANTILQDPDLDIRQKVSQLQALEEQTIGYETKAFSEVWESLHTRATPEELSYLAGLDD